MFIFCDGKIIEYSVLCVLNAFFHKPDGANFVKCLLLLDKLVGFFIPNVCWFVPLQSFVHTDGKFHLASIT